ncbi:hybrid sensor histidine kinase/response regulator [Novosphingobium sp.]|uniref:hybrid sensor histidine kinase/response regulator n=1 Tax=Novosphingobium sp. TaxID=1874826 RepID=UPI0027372521|nr:hybrid sensor histidine kinase/response regulator [Novosphingobium sp.]MDP3907711.1 hybrid sensor histidine kinase/response regulator [Novosphingobium sp.]
MTAPAGQIHREVRAAESRMEFALTGLLSLLVAGTLAYVHWLFEPLVPPAQLWGWSGFMGGVTAIMMIVPLAVHIRQPDAAQIERFWSPLGKVVAVLFDLAVASSVWVLLPYASEPLQLLMVIFYSAAISGQVITTAESIGTVVFGVIAVLGSAALFFFRSETAYSTSLALFLLAFGALMIGTALVLKQAIRTAITLRLRAESMSADLADALAATHAERDARARFIAAASHDLRQPLQAASLYFRQVQRVTDPARRAQAADGVNRGLAEAMVMLESMAEHLRLESGTLRAQPEPVALAHVFAALAQELAPTARQSDIALRFAATERNVLADPALLTRILRNLVSNAILHSQGRRVRVLARGAGDQVAIHVIDDGIGLGSQPAENLFLPYSQGQDSRRLGRGSGLGLTIAREMAQLMDGALVADPRWRAGCAFTLTLPAVQAVVRPPAGLEAVPVADLSGQRLLVVDDHSDARDALAQLLRLHGADVRAVETVADVGAVLAQGWVPAAAVTDWHLGLQDTGADVAALIRAADPAARVVVMSGDAALATAQQVAALDCALLLKPVDEAALLQALSDQ